MKPLDPNTTSFLTFVPVKAVKAIVSCILALLVLFTSMGFYVDHMVCAMSGEHRLAINASVQDCTDSCERGEEGLERSCCDYESKYFQEDHEANPTQSGKKQLASAFKYTPVLEFISHSACSEKCCTHLLEKPDIFPSVERHVLLETFLI